MKTILYKSIMRALMYLAITSTRDICYTVSMVAQYNSKLRENHWSCVKKIFIYLNGTINDGLIYDRNESLKVIEFCDANSVSDLIKT